jgi:hypothetical protein
MAIYGLTRAGAKGLKAMVVVVIGLVSAVQASPSASLNAAGTVPLAATLELPANLTSLPPVVEDDFTAMKVSIQQPLLLSANVPSTVSLSTLEIEAPPGVDLATVGASFKLISQGTVLVDASTSGGSLKTLPLGAHEASVSARFYSTNQQTLPAGRYRASTLISVYAD